MTGAVADWLAAAVLAEAQRHPARSPERRAEAVEGAGKDSPWKRTARRSMGTASVGAFYGAHQAGGPGRAYDPKQPLGNR